MYADVIWDLKINVSERKYLKYQQNDEGNDSSRNKSTYIIFVGTFGGLAPSPNTKKLATLVEYNDCVLSHFFWTLIVKPEVIHVLVLDTLDILADN